MPEPKEKSGDFSVIDASAALEGLLAREEEGNEQPEEQEAGETAEKPETPEVKEPAEGDEAEAEQEAEPEEEAEQPLYTVKVDGKEQQVTLEELQRGYSGQKWISQRSQTLAAERKTLEAETARVTQERAQYAQVLGQLAKQLEGGEAEPDWEKLRAEDEFKFVVERQAWQLKQDRLNAVKAEQTRVSGLQSEQHKKALSEKIIEENRKALEFIPAWKDKAVARKEVAELRAFALKGGWTEEELDQATDARAVRALYAEYTLNKLANTQKPRPVVRGPRSASPGAGAATPGRPAEVTRLKQRLAQTGSVDDAAKLFEQNGVFE